MVNHPIYESDSPLKVTIIFQRVEFLSEGVILRGRLYPGSDPSKPAPAVIMAHGFSATINGMVADRYAEVFHQAGFAILLYDHYSLGESDGEPRQQMHPWMQTRGYIDAITFLESLPEIDSSRIALWGDSMSGAEVIVAGAVDERVKVIVAQVPTCGREHAPPDPDGELFSTIREILLNGDLASIPQIITGPMPVASLDQAITPSLLLPVTAYHWFTEYGNREGTLWQNWGTRVALKTSAPLHSALCAPHLKVPLQMIVAYEDEMPGANSEVVRRVFELAPEPKELIEIEGGHFGLVYYPGEVFDLASQAQKDFLEKYL